MGVVLWDYLWLDFACDSFGIAGRALVVIAVSFALIGSSIILEVVFTDIAVVMRSCLFEKKNMVLRTFRQLLIPHQHFVKLFCLVKLCLEF